MSESRTTLTYGTRRRSRRLPIIVSIFVICVLIGAGWFFRADIKQFSEDALADWRFRRAFDAASDDLIQDGNIWFAPAGPASADNRAGQHLNGLLSQSPQQISRYRGTRPNFVLFVQAGETNGRRWLAFACINAIGLHVYSFDRSERNAAAYWGHFVTPTFWSKDAFRVVVRKIESLGATVKTSVEVEGGLNEIDWTLAPALAPGAGVGVSRLVTSSVTPRDGFVSSGQWEPNTRGWRLMEGGRPTAELSGAPGPFAIAFLPDGRLAAANPKVVRLLSSENTEVTSHHLPDSHERAEVFVFSQDGSKLFVGGTTEPASVIDTVLGRARPMPIRISGMPKVAFPDERSLLLLDNVLQIRIDWETMQHAAIGDDVAASGSFFGFGAAGDILALPSNSQHARIVRLAQNTSIYVEQIPGMDQLSLSPDGRWLAMKWSSGLSLVDAATGTVIWDHALDNDFHTVRSRVKWSDDGLIGAVAGNRYAYVWSLREPRTIVRFPHGRKGHWPDVALSHDGRRLAASASGSEMIGYWPDLNRALRVNRSAVESEP